MAQHPEIIVNFANTVPSNDVELMAALYADDLILSDPLYDNVTGKEGIRAAMRSWYQAFRCVSFEIVETMVDGSRIAGHFNWVAIHQGEFMGVPPSGREFSSWVISLFDTRDGLFTRELATWDVTQLWRLQAQQESA